MPSHHSGRYEDDVTLLVDRFRERERERERERDTHTEGERDTHSKKEREKGQERGVRGDRKRKAIHLSRSTKHSNSVCAVYKCTPVPHGM